MPCTLPFANRTRERGIARQSGGALRPHRPSAGAHESRQTDLWCDGVRCMAASPRHARLLLLESAAFDSANFVTKGLASDELPRFSVNVRRVCGGFASVSRAAARYCAAA